MSPTSACIYFPEGYGDEVTQEDGLHVVENFIWKVISISKSS